MFLNCPFASWQLEYMLNELSVYSLTFYCEKQWKKLLSKYAWEGVDPKKATCGGSSYLIQPSPFVLKICV